MRLAVYPGRSTPSRSATSTSSSAPARLFDRLVVAVLVNTRKSPSLRGRGPREHHPRGHRRGAARDLAAGIEVTTFEGLTVELARQRGAMAHRAGPARRSATSRTSWPSRTSTASWRPASTPCSS